MSSLLPPKVLNFSPLRITGDTTIAADTYNVIYADIAAPSTLTLPDLTLQIDGAPMIIVNNGSEDLDVELSDTTPVDTVSPGFLYILICNKTPPAPVWRVIYGPSPSTGLVAGPASSTDNALVRWNGTTGELIQNSVAILSDTGSLTGVTDITLATTGGTPTALDYYEEFTLTGNTFTGAFGAAQDCEFQISRVGRIVTVLIPATDAAAAGVAAPATSTVAIPARFRPNASNGPFVGTYHNFTIRSGGAGATDGLAQGLVTVNISTGIVVIGAFAAGGPGNFATTDSNGWPEQTLTWSV